MKYYFLIQSGALGLYKDLYSCENVKFYSIGRALNPDFWLSVLLFGVRCLDKIFGSDFRKKIDYTHIPLAKEACFIIESGFLRRIDIDFFECLKSSGAKICLLLIDSMGGASPDLMLAKERIFSTKWDQVYTIDKIDADEYGWNYIGLNYYSKPKIFSKGITSDAYFVGGLKGGRDSIILNLFHKLKGASNPLFDLLCYTNEQFENRESMGGLNYSTEWQPYKNILKKIAGTNCIIEILQENQSCQSIRYFEAVALNKKLLTNNKNVFELPFYDEKYIRYFENIDDVDVEWIKKRESVNYHYDNRFSPGKLLRQIRRDVENI